MTRKEAIEQINLASAVYVQPRLGVSERWVRIAKREAEYLLNGFERDGRIEVDVERQRDGSVYLS